MLATRPSSRQNARLLRQPVSRDASPSPDCETAPRRNGCRCPRRGAADSRGRHQASAAGCRSSRGRRGTARTCHFALYRAGYFALNYERMAAIFPIGKVPASDGCRCPRRGAADIGALRLDAVTQGVAPGPDRKRVSGAPTRPANEFGKRRHREGWAPEFRSDAVRRRRGDRLKERLRGHPNPQGGRRRAAWRKRGLDCRSVRGARHSPIVTGHGWTYTWVASTAS